LGLALFRTGEIVTAQTFLPADALGPVVEHLVLREGASF